MNTPQITVTISHDLIADVRETFYNSLISAFTHRNVGIIGKNCYTSHAYSAYIVTVASVEAFINEVFLGWICKSRFKDSALWELKVETLNRMNLSLKLVIISQLLFDHVLKRGEQPLQDFEMLIRIRNDLVHFKMDGSAPKYIKELENREIALVSKPGDAGPWPWKLSSTEGIRWAHNSACNMISYLVSLIPDGIDSSFARCASNFQLISDSDVQSLLDTIDTKSEGD